MAKDGADSGGHHHGGSRAEGVRPRSSSTSSSESSERLTASTGTTSGGAAAVRASSPLLEIMLRGTGESSFDVSLLRASLLAQLAGGGGGEVAAFHAAVAKGQSAGVVSRGYCLYFKGEWARDPYGEATFSSSSSSSSLSPSPSPPQKRPRARSDGADDERELDAGLLLSSLARAAGGGGGGDGDVSVGVSLVTLDWDVRANRDAIRAKEEMQLGARLIAIGNNDSSWRADVVLVSAASCPRLFKVIYGSFLGNPELQAAAAGRAFPRKHAFLLVGRGLLRDAPRPHHQPSSRRSSIEEVEEEQQQPRRLRPQPPSASASTSANGAWHVGAVMRILKDRGFLVGGDEEETAAAMKGLRGYKDDVLRSYGEGLWEEFWRHGRPAPIVKARTCQFGCTCHSLRKGRTGHKCRDIHPGQPNYVPSPLVRCPQAKSCIHAKQRRCLFNHDAERGVNTIKPGMPVA